MISAGRLETQKNHKLLVDSFAKIAAVHKNWNLKIYGEGSLRGLLETRVKILNIEDRVSIEPATKDIYHALSNAHLFVLSSAHEGFPNILAEAVATGLPCIGFASVSGVPELITDGENGVLLRDEQRNSDGLATAISSLIGDSERRQIMSENCKLIAVNYKPTTVHNAWVSLILELTSPRKSTE